MIADKATVALKNDHRIIEKVLDVLEKLAAHPEVGAIATWEKALDFIRNFADKCHHLKEEKVFFPALEEHGIPLRGGPIGVMLQEHGEGRDYVRAMGEALALTKEDPMAGRTLLAEHAKRYLRLLREHIQKEDQILFNVADEVLTLEEQKELVRQFEEHEEQEIGLEVHEKYVKIAHELANTQLKVDGKAA